MVAIPGSRVPLATWNLQPTITNNWSAGAAVHSGLSLCDLTLVQSPSLCVGVLLPVVGCCHGVLSFTRYVRHVQVHDLGVQDPVCDKPCRYLPM